MLLLVDWHSSLHLIGEYVTSSRSATELSIGSSPSIGELPTSLALRFQNQWSMPYRLTKILAPIIGDEL